jgi:hypothetical protein
MYGPEFYTILSFAFLAVAVMNLIVVILDKKWRSLDEWMQVVYPLMLFAAYSKIVELLSS